MSSTAPALSPEFEEYGVAECPQSNSAFSLSSPVTAWLVRRGKLDLFLICSRNGQDGGARHPVMRVEEGCAVVGVGERPDAVLVATAAPGTELLRLDLNAIRDSAAAIYPDILEAIEDWIDKFSAILISDPPPGAVLTIETGQVLQQGETTQVLTPMERLVWLVHRECSSRFLGLENLPAIDAASGAFPLSKHAWLSTEGGGEAYAAGMHELAALDPEWTGLQHFGRIAMERLASRRSSVLEAETRRLQSRTAADDAVFRRAMLRLATPIEKVRDVAEGQDSCTDPVFLASQVIGERIGVRVRPHPDMLRGVSMSDPVAAVSRTSGIRARRVTLRGDWWKTDNGCLLAFREQDNRPMAVLPRPGKRNEVYDPIERRFLRLTGQIAEGMNASAYVLYRPFPRAKMGALELLRFATRGCGREFACILLTGLAAGVLGTAFPFATGIIFDHLIPGAQRSELALMCAYLTVTMIALGLLQIARGYAVLRLQGRMDSSLQAAVWDRLLSLPVSFFKDYNAGDLAQRSMGIARIRDALTGATLTAVLSGIFSMFSFALLFYYSWRLALVATGLVALMSLAALVCGAARVRQERQLVTLEGKISGVLLQFVTGIAKFRVSGTERRAFSVWARQFAGQKKTAVRARQISNGLAVFSAVFPLFCGACLFLCYASNPSITAGMSAGDFIAFLAAFTQFLDCGLSLSTAVVNALGVVPLYERARPIFATLPEVSAAKTAPGRLSGGIELSHVTFGYKKDAPPVLRDVSLKILPGEFVAFVGSSGSGKSTLFRLLLGFEDPDAGAVYYDSQDLAGLDIEAVRRQIGVVLQTSKPVNGSIFDNIVGSSPLTLDDAWQAARASGFDEDIKRMPMGMHTFIPDGGGGISGGQRQRLLIARSIASRPRILLFDEATSAIDNRAQETVSRSLRELKATRIVIAHRFSTITGADRIFVLEKGSIVQSGTYSQLLREDGLFRRLAERQIA